MEFTINRDIFLKSLGHAYGVIEKKTTLPILSNILIEAKSSKIKITATDLDIIYSEEIQLEELKKEGSTTTSANILYDILRKLEPNDEAYFSLQDVNKLGLISGNSKFNLLCIPPDNFPLADEDIKKTAFEISSPKMLKLLNKSKISISNLIFDLLLDILIALVLCSNKEISWKIVFFGKIIDSKSILESISSLLEESLWLSVATLDRNDLFSIFILCR